MNEAVAKMKELNAGLYNRALAACEKLGSAPMKVRLNKLGHGTFFVEGPVVEAKPAYFKRAGRGLVVIFEAVIETTHPTTGAKNRHTVFIKRLPT